MATVRKTLGQSKPAAATDATLYTVPGSTDTVISTIVIAETGGAATTARICSDSAGGTSTAVGKALAWDLAIPANSVTTLTLGITLAAASTLLCRSLSGSCTFTAFGQENS
jgi:hypothetical protein